ncbi:MAG: glycosyltransferase family 39 protein [Phycisphaerae bacterium]|nr:glycosyltransferase family 39 protein [Phycisphaerae bacterium]
MNRHPEGNQRRRLRNVRVAPPDPQPDRFRHRVIDLCAVVGLSIMVIALGGKEIGVGGFSWSDAPLHAMDGVFLHDLVVANDVHGDVQGWAARFYARYPCLGLIVYYPPLHPILEAAAYFLFGISEGVARATIVAMGVLAVLGLYWVGVRLYGRPAAIIAAGLLATAPFGLRWLREVMLEWPAVAFAILAVGCYRAWYDRPSWKWAVLGALAIIAALLTKQTTVFLLALFPIHLITVAVVAAARGDWPPGPQHRRHESDLKMGMTVAVAAIIVLVVLGLYDLMSSRYAEFSRFLVSGRPPWVHLRDIATYTQYFRWFDEIFGWPLMIAWLLGLALIVLRWDWKGTRIPLLWIVLVWVQQTVIAWKEPRYFFLALPAAALIAGRGWTLWPKWRRFPIGLAPMGGLIAYQFIGGLLTPANRLPSYAAAVQLLADRPDADVVLMDGVRDGQFVFDVRTNPKTAGRLITLRGSKVLYARAARGRWRHATLLADPEEILALLNQYGIKYIVVESQLPAISAEARSDWQDPASRVFRQMLADQTRFELIGHYPLRCEDPAWDDVELRVYHYRLAPPRQSKQITIPIKALGRDVVVDLP